MKRLLVMVFVLCMMFSTTVTAVDDYNWIEGGQPVDLGGIATVDLDPEFVFLDGENTKRMSQDYGETVTGLEVGSIFPMDENATWRVYFDYEESGHIKNAKKEKIDAKALLKSYKEGTEEANKERQPGDRFYVKDWDIKPFFEDETYNLTWSILLEDENKETFLNYNTRILTREGNISIVLITDPQNRDAHRKLLEEKILSKFKVNDGKRYEDFDKSTDKVSEYGLSALILGGAGLAVAKKAGLLATILVFGKKFGVIIVAAIAGLWGLIRKKKKDNQASEQDDSINQQK
ncbi:DUF2167 domain-containing protein [Ferdinandcohnia quinoae]|uniref:DUF2167 domain-containing protein n=1 Tax=Fredinandcohnia quinoae TaxID=2918902 RepID=A0AAW5DXA1_9BACI|nr:DUF2167 domain-containing protein [Fredinandcohnia sp. SECRCQ15]MCH1625276.1 DUF2167 domain-containing protein [Fredinandcohnia sp. SECRCQ15]